MCDGNLYAIEQYLKEQERRDAHEEYLEEHGEFYPPDEPEGSPKEWNGEI